MNTIEENIKTHKENNNEKSDPKAYVIAAIEDMFKDNECGFELFIKMKSNSGMKRFCFYEGNNNNFKSKIEGSITNAIKEKFLADDAEYTMAEKIADNQNKFYLIKQSDSYRPFDFLISSENEAGNFSVTERDDAEAIIFRFARDGKIIWAYQYIVAANIPNKKKENFLAKIFSTEKQDRFVEMDELLFPITQKINLLVIEEYIITKDIGFMQRHFGFEEFVRGSARDIVSDISAIGIVSNDDKLIEYIQRTKTKYAKRIMRINTFNVINKSAEELLQRIATVKRWQGVFDITGGKINLHTYRDVENLIDLFDERFTKSLITDDEFDTDVKILAIPAIQDK